MAEADASALRFLITADDRTAGPLAKVRTAFGGLVPATTAANRQISLFNRGISRSPLGRLGRELAQAATALRGVSSPIGTLTGALTIGGLVRMTSAWGSYGTALGNTAARLQTGADSLASMQGAARLLGSTTQDLTSSLAGFRETMTDALGGRNSEAVGYLGMLGMSMRNARGEINKGREGFDQLLDSIARIRDPELQSRLMRVFGVAENLWPAARRGSAAFRAMEADLRRLRPVLQGDTEAATAFGQAQMRLGEAIGSVGDSITRRLAPPLTGLMNRMATSIADHRELASAGTLVAGVVGGTMAVAFGRLALSMVGIGSTLGALATFRLPLWVLPMLGLGAAGVGGLGALAGEAERDPNGGTLAQRLRRWLEDRGVPFQQPGETRPPSNLGQALQRRGWTFRSEAGQPGQGVAGGLPPPLAANISEQVGLIARLGGVREGFAQAIARNEGGTGRVSPAGAIGTMQLMPDTARGLGVDPNNQQQNVIGGVRYLRQLLQRFGGDELVAGAAYNAGPNRASVRHFAETGDRSRLPRETQQYLSRLEAQGVQGNIAVRVDIGNAPPGTRATATATGGGVTVAPPRVERAMPGAVGP